MIFKTRFKIFLSFKKFFKLTFCWSRNKFGSIKIYLKTFLNRKNFFNCFKILKLGFLNFTTKHKIFEQFGNKKAINIRKPKMFNRSFETGKKNFFVEISFIFKILERIPLDRHWPSAVWHHSRRLSSKWTSGNRGRRSDWRGDSGECAHVRWELQETNGRLLEGNSVRKLFRDDRSIVQSESEVGGLYRSEDREVEKGQGGGGETRGTAEREG